MAVLPAPPINWGGDAPQSMTVLVPRADIGEVVIAPSEASVIPAPAVGGSAPAPNPVGYAG